jgi:hypothetical protein
MVVLDTDHTSELGFRSAAGLRLLERLTATGEDATHVDADKRYKLQSQRPAPARRLELDNDDLD